MTRLSNDLADWYPTLVRSGVPTPATTIIRSDVDLSPLVDGVAPHGISTLVEQVVDAAGRLGFPAFLRTGHTSGKHDFARTAFLRDPSQVLPHIAALVEHSAMSGVLGLPTDTWVVREFLPIRPAFLAFRGLPITAERRYFFNGLGQVTGHHPYWPDSAIAQGSPRGPHGPMAEQDWRRVLDVLNAQTEDEVALLSALTEQVAAAFEGQGSWSVDYLYTSDRGWVAIDMARFEDSFIWHGHPDAPFSMRAPAQFTGLPSSQGPAGRVEAELLTEHGLV